MIALYARIFDLLSNGNAPAAVWAQITSEEDFQYLVPDDHEQRLEAQRGGAGLRFERKAKSAGFFEQFLPQVAKCPLCGGLLHSNGMVSDHKLERAKGGSSASANVQLVHPICTSNKETSE